MDLELLKRIEKSSAHTLNRIENGNFIVKNDYLLPDLIEFCFITTHKLHILACCILEKVLEIRLDLSYQYLELICQNISKLKNDSAIRSISRFLMLMAKDNSSKNYLSKLQKERIVEVCFDWLILDYRVAVKHNAILILYELGKNHGWIYSELKLILEKQIVESSPG